MAEELDILDRPLIKFTNNPSDWWTYRDALNGVQIFGTIGSGKSSGSGKAIAYSFLKNGFGGIVLTGKVDETETWLKYAEHFGRLDDVLIFGPSRKLDGKKLDYRLKFNHEFKFNPLEYLGQDNSAGSTDNIVSLFTSIIKMGDRFSGMGQGSSADPFWDRALQRLMKSAIDLIRLAKAGFLFTSDSSLNPKDLETYFILPETKIDTSRFNLTIANIVSSIRSAPIAGQNIADDNFTIDCLSYAKEFTSMLDDPKVSRIYEEVENYFLNDFATMPDKTRGSLLETFYSFASPFTTGILADYFSTETSKKIIPEKTFSNSSKPGKIIILDFPVKEYLLQGIYAQAIYKKLWQQAVESRKVEKSSPPVFIWVDESQFFLTEDDMLFQTTARSSRASTVLISQNISNYYASIGGSNAQARVNSLLGNLSTKIFHSNNDHITNEWAANTIGKTFQSQMNVNVGDSANTSLATALHYQVEPQLFTMLRNGGTYHNFEVDGVVTVSGKVWSNGKNYLKTFFYQKDERINS